MQNPTPDFPPHKIDRLRSISYKEAPNPAYIIQTDLLEENCKLLKEIQDDTGAKILLAQKGFACFSTYPLIKNYLAGTTSSGLHEALLAQEHFGKEIHVYAPAFKESEIQTLAPFAHSIIFNSVQQLCSGLNLLGRDSQVALGLRINPESSTGSVDLYNPCAKDSRLGVTKSEFEESLKNYGDAFLNSLSGLHFHTLCEEDADALEKTAKLFEEQFGVYLKDCQWLNFGGGHHITRPGYNVSLLKEIIAHFREKYQVTIYLEPGEAVALQTGVLNTQVLDILEKDSKSIAILNCSATCHMPDVLEMPYRPNVLDAGMPGEKAHTYCLAGLSCLSGDVIGDYSFDRALKVGDHLQFLDMSHYTMVKTSTFNGVPLPAICLHSEQDGLKTIRTFSYEDYKKRLS